jgi:Ser-tRNA(Ala) deacylase AlaX
MSELPAYERDPYLTVLETRVVETGEEGGRPYAVLADTLLFPEGGGQPADRGVLEGLAVTDVQKRAGRILHFLARPLDPAAPATLTVSLDWNRRFDHMQQHTGQHLLTAVAQDRFGWETTAFHLGEQVSDIELGVPRIGEADLAILEEAVAVEIRRARPVTCRRVAPEALPGLAVRSRGLPEGFTGDVRLVEIQGLDLNTCGGTHLRSTAELEALCLLGTEPVRGGTRLVFACGARARARMLAHERRNGALRALLGVPEERLAEAVTARQDQHRELERRVRLLEDELAETLAAALAAGPGVLAERHFEGKELSFLQRTARALTARAPGRTVFLTATQAGQSCFLLASGPDSPMDAAVLGRELATILSAKGGGSGALFQGKAPSLEGRDRALALLKTAAGG